MTATSSRPAGLVATTRRLRRKPRKPRPCTCGTGCGVMEGFCDAYRMQLAVWARELEQESAQRSVTKSKRPDHPVCTTEGCWRPRQAPLPVCSSCAEEAE